MLTDSITAALTPRQAVLFTTFIARGCALHALLEAPKAYTPPGVPPPPPPVVATPIEVLEWFSAPPVRAALDAWHASRLAAEAFRTFHLRARALDSLDAITASSGAQVPQRRLAAQTVLKEITPRTPPAPRLARTAEREIRSPSSASPSTPAAPLATDAKPPGDHANSDSNAPAAPLLAPAERSKVARGTPAESGLPLESSPSVSAPAGHASPAAPPCAPPDTG